MFEDLHLGLALQSIKLLNPKPEALCETGG